jgi:hypothetical protein
MVVDGSGNISGIKSEAIIATGDANLGDVGNVKIYGGQSGQIISTDGVGGLSFIDGPDINNFKPTGVNSSIQMNYGGAFGADANLYYQAANRILFTPEISTDGFRIGNITGANVAGPVRTALEAYRVDAANIIGNVPVSISAISIPGANVIGKVANSSVSDYSFSANVANWVIQPVQANITTVGVLTHLYANDASVSGNVQVSNTLNTLNFQVNQYANLGPVSNISIFGGTSGQYLQTTGSGDITWADLIIPTQRIQFSPNVAGSNIVFQDPLLESYANAGDMTLLKDGVLLEAEIDYTKPTANSVKIIPY